MGKDSVEPFLNFKDSIILALLLKRLSINIFIPEIAFIANIIIAAVATLNAPTTPTPINCSIKKKNYDQNPSIAPKIFGGY